MSFVRADILKKDNSDVIPLPKSLIDITSEIIPGFEQGFITLIQSDQLKDIHKALHETMLEAYNRGMQVKLVDMTNCFNPHIFSQFSQFTNINLNKLLKNIQLARPFQMYQCISIINQLLMRTESATSKYLIVVTDISAQFFQAAENADPKTLFKILDDVRHMMGGLQKLSTRGHTIIITNDNSREGATVLNKMFSTIAKIHLSISHRKQVREIRLVNHPYLATSKRLIPLHLKKKRRKKLESMPLTGFF
jgi:hypothetical protein